MISAQSFTSRSCTPFIRFGAAETDSARRSFEEYVQLWSRDEAVNARSVGRYYAPVATYYGRRMSRAQILADKLAYIRAYPRRDYRIEPGTIGVACNAARKVCRTSGLLTVRLEDRRGRATMQRSRLRLIMISQDGGQIIKESADRLPSR